MFAESICVNLKNGETVRFSIESVENVTICEDLPIFLNSVVDESQTPLKFKLLSDSTLEVIKDDSYQELAAAASPIASTSGSRAAPSGPPSKRANWNCPAGRAIRS